jgi:hypothetical protein
MFTLCVLVAMGSAFAGIWLQWSLRRRLVKRHPAVWLEMSGRSWFGSVSTADFVFSGRHRELADPELTRTVVQMRWTVAIFCCSWLLTMVEHGWPR